MEDFHSLNQPAFGSGLVKQVLSPRIVGEGPLSHRLAQTQSWAVALFCMTLGISFWAPIPYQLVKVPETLH